MLIVASFSVTFCTIHMNVVDYYYASNTSKVFCTFKF